MPEPGVRGGVELVGKARSRHEIAHEHEERHDCQAVGHAGIEERLAEERERRCEADHVGDSAQAYGGHREGDGQAHDHEDDKGHEAHEPDCHLAELGPESSASPSATGAAEGDLRPVAIAQELKSRKHALTTLSAAMT